MTSLEQIQITIEKLSPSDISRLRVWLDELDASLFDEKIERDAKNGKLDDLIQRARADAQAGRDEDL